MPKRSRSGTEGDLSRCVARRQGDGNASSRNWSPALEPATRRSHRRRRFPGPPAPAAPGASRDRPALATSAMLISLNRTGSEKDMRHVVIDLSGSGVTYKPGDSLGVFARRIAAAGPVRARSTGLPAARKWSLPTAMPCRCARRCCARSHIARPSDDCCSCWPSALSMATEAAAPGTGARRGAGALDEADLLDLLLAFPSVTPSLPGHPEVARSACSRASTRSPPRPGPSRRGPPHRSASSARTTRRAAAQGRRLLPFWPTASSPATKVRVFVHRSHGFRAARPTTTRR